MRELGFYGFKEIFCVENKDVEEDLQVAQDKLEI